MEIPKMKLMGTGVTAPHCIAIVILLGMETSTASNTLDVPKQFLLDTMEHFGSTTPVFVTRGDTCCCYKMAFLFARFHLCYEKDYEASDVLKVMQLLFDDNELNIIFLLGNGHEDLLSMTSGDFNLLNSGVTLVTSHKPDTSLIKLRLDSKLFFFTELGGKIHLSEIYSIKSLTSIERVIGEWSEETGLVVAIPNIWERRADLMDTHLDCVTLGYTFLTQVHHDSRNKNLTKVTGLFDDYLSQLESQLNFTAKVSLSKDGMWGSMAEDRMTWNGMVGMLIKNETDIGTAGLTRTLLRDKVVDFGIPMEQSIITLIQARNVIHLPDRVKLTLSK
jgi:hypothetical protein